MKKIKTAFAILSLAALGFASCAPTADLNSRPNGQQQQQRPQGGRQQPGGQGGGDFPTAEQLMTEMDANKDGKLSKAEVKGPLANDFARIDANEDNFLSLEELKKAPKPSRR